MGKIANKTIQYSVYDKTSGKSESVGDTTSYKRPDIEFLSDTLKGAGIMGEIDFPTLGQIGNLEGEMTFNKSNKQFMSLFSPGTHKIEVRWATDVVNSSDGSVSIEGNKEIIHMIPKTASLGNIETNSTNEATITYTITYYNYLINGESIVEIDKFNNVFKINGTDYSADLRKVL